MSARCSEGARVVIKGFSETSHFSRTRIADRRNRRLISPDAESIQVLPLNKDW